MPRVSDNDQLALFGFLDLLTKVNKMNTRASDCAIKNLVVLLSEEVHKTWPIFTPIRFGP